MKDYYNSEIEGMIDFYKTLGFDKKVDYDCNTDGSINGCIVEFKLAFEKMLTHKNQVKRYLKAYNAIAKPIPRKALLIDINNRKYISGDVSTTNGDVSIQWDSTESYWSTPNELFKFFNLSEYCKGWIDEESIISYNNLFCTINNKKTTSKEDVRDEFINPCKLKIHPFDWHGQIEREKRPENDNDWLTFNMNMLGSETLKKQLGAFFTPDRYVRLSTEYIRNAIKNVPSGMDYVVIDRCAGSGNLEKFFNNEELSHFILNTIDYTEWTTLKGLYEGRVRYIIPHDSKSRNNETGLMGDGDALQKSFYEKLLPMIENKYVIMLENPPFAGTAGIRGGAKGTLKDKKYSYINQEMKSKGFDGNVCKDLLVQFVWSAFEIVKCNEYILYGPVMWWKSNHITDKKFIAGHMCNRKDFNTNADSGILLAHWVNESESNESLPCTTNSGDFYHIRKKHTFITDLLNKYKISIDKNNLRNPEEDELALMFSTSSTLDSLNGGLFNRLTYRTELVTSAGLKMSKITKKNIKQLSVIQCVNCYRPDNYYEVDVVMKAADKSDAYKDDIQLLEDCFLYTVLSNKTKCISDSLYTNQLCLLQGTIADELLSPEQKKHKLLALWKDVLSEVRSGNKPEYNPLYKYGLHQIEDEINVRIETGTFDKKGNPKFKKKYAALDEKIDLLKIELKEFFNETIKPKLFLYELIK